jgi:hypothetical protein
MDNTRPDKRGGIIAFQADAELIATADAISAEESISRSDVARRALKDARCSATRVRRPHDSRPRLRNSRTCRRAGAPQESPDAPRTFTGDHDGLREAGAALLRRRAAGAAGSRTQSERLPVIERRNPQ